MKPANSAGLSLAVTPPRSEVTAPIQKDVVDCGVPAVSADRALLFSPEGLLLAKGYTRIITLEPKYAKIHGGPYLELLSEQIEWDSSIRFRILARTAPPRTTNIFMNSAAMMPPT